MSAQPQSINVADLDVSQLSDVRKQLEEVSLYTSLELLTDPLFLALAGNKPPYKFVRATEASTSEVKSLYR